MFALANFSHPVLTRLTLSLAAASATIALTCNEAVGQYYQQSTSFGASFNSSSSRGFGPGGFYNTNSRSSNWNASINSSRGGFTPSGYQSSGYNLNVGGARSNSWGQGVGPSGPWGYNNRNQGSYINGGTWCRGW